MNMQQIDKGLRDTEVSQRKDFLIRQLNRLEIYHTSDGRKLEDCSLYTLEWTYIELKNDSAKAYGDNLEGR